MKKILVIFLFLTQPALATEQALLDCRRIDEVAARVVCYDQIVDSISMADSEQGAEVSPPPDAQSLFGKNDAEAKRIVETSFAIDQIVQIEAKVTDVQKSAHRKLTVTLDNGQIWRQLDNQRMPLKRGETVIVREASLGSFLLEKTTGSRSIRVKRAN